MRDKHTKGSLHHGTRAKRLRGVHHAGMKRSVRHKAHWSVRPTGGKAHTREYTRKTGTRH